MKTYKKIKIVMIGAGSVNFCPATLNDIVLSDLLNQRKLEVVLMDIDAQALQVSLNYGQQLISMMKREIVITATTNLEVSLEDADFVITAIEKERYYYWSQDFHVPKKYGFRQVYGENGGPGGMFHFLRNIGPMLAIANAMEKLCPDAYLINYTNPEAKLVEAISKITGIKVVGVCHGYSMGVKQVAKMLEREPEELDVLGYGLNHFGFMTEIKEKATGKDLYPEFKTKERKGHWLSNWDEIGLSRVFLHLYGYYPYPGTNHIGEYMEWSDEFLASSKIQYFYDPLLESIDDRTKDPTFVYCFSTNPTGIPFNHKDEDREESYLANFNIKGEDIKCSNEYGIPIIEGIVFDLNTYIPSLNMPNQDTIPGILNGMCVEGPCTVNKDGIHPIKMKGLPLPIEAMINRQGYIHKMLIEAFEQKSRNKLLHAVLFDPTVSTYNNAIAMLNEIFELQKEMIAPLEWEDVKK